MGDSSGKDIKVAGFSQVYEQMCNFLAVSKTGNQEETIKGLIILCFLLRPSERFSSFLQIRNTIVEIFGVEIGPEKFEQVIRELLKLQVLSQPAESNFVLTLSIRKEFEKRIKQTHEVESNVKQKWFDSISASYPQLNHEMMWDALRKYLYKAFRRHGIQAVALLDPTIDTSPDYDVSLSSMLRDSVKEANGNYNEQAVQLIMSFMAEVGTDPLRTQYIAQLADGAFNFYTLGVEPEVVKKLSMALTELTLFLDTNFLIGILGLHNNWQVDVSNNLIGTIQNRKLPFRLRYHEATEKEMYSTIQFYGSILKSRKWSKILSKAAVRAGNLSGIELMYHSKNSAGAIDVDEFLRPFIHFDELLKSKNILRFNLSENGMKESLDLYNEYEGYLDEHGKSFKTPETIKHDIIVLNTVRQLRSASKSSLEAGALFISCDYLLYRFNWEWAKKNNQLAFVLLPNIFWQVLRPFIPPSFDFDKSFASTFMLPEFRSLAGGSNMACSKMLQILATYKDLSEEMAFRLLSNDILINRLKAVESNEEFAACVEGAFIEENNNLLKENASLAQQIKAQAQEFGAKLRAETDEKEALQKEHNIANDLLEKKEGELSITQQEVIKNQLEADREREQKAKSEKLAFKMTILAGVSVSLALSLCFELCTHLIPWQWLLNQQKSTLLQLEICILIALLSVGLIVKKWRNWCWGTGVFDVLLLLLTSIL